MPSDTNIWGKLHSKTTTKCRYFLFDQAWWRNGEGIRLDYITAALLLKARVNAHEEHAEVTLSHLKIILTDWFLVSYKSIQGLASTVAFLGWGLVTKTAKKKNRVKRLHVTHHMSKIKKKKNQRHPPLDIKGNSPTNLEKAKQTKSCHKKKKKGELCSCTDLYHSGTGGAIQWCQGGKVGILLYNKAILKTHVLNRSYYSSAVLTIFNKPIPLCQQGI